MLKKLRLKIALWFINTEDELNKEMMEIANGITMEFTSRVRSEYIITTKLSIKLAEEIAHAEELLKNHTDYKSELINDMQEIVDKKQVLQSEYTKRLFAFHGMFDAYKIRRVTKEELQ